MTYVIVIKLILLSFIWSIFWFARFTYISAPVNTKNICISFAPWILFLIYFIFFWWG